MKTPLCPIGSVVKFWNNYGIVIRWMNIVELQYEVELKNGSTLFVNVDECEYQFMAA
jgi:hypothetical protein